MRVLVLAAQKGGSNKTTLALNLAVEAMRQCDGPVTLIDTDPQASLTKWWNRRAENEPKLAQIDIRRIDQELAALKVAGTKLVVIDTPGVITANVKAVIRAASLVVIPCRASILDVETLYEFCDVIEAERRPMMFVPSSIKPRTRISSDAIRNLSAFGTVGPTISDRVDYSQSLNDGRAACELRPDGDATKEVAALWNYVKTRLRKSASAEMREDATT